MNVDNALANFIFQWNVGSGDTSRRGVEHRNSLQLRFTHQIARLRLCPDTPSKTRYEIPVP